MTADELRNLVFETLYEKLQGADGDPSAFVGLQGDKVVVMQPGGEHYAIVVHPAKVGAPA